MEVSSTQRDNCCPFFERMARVSLDPSLPTCQLRQRGYVHGRVHAIASQHISELPWSRIRCIRMDRNQAALVSEALSSRLAAAKA